MPRTWSGVIIGIVLIASGLASISEKSEVTTYIQKYWWIPMVLIALLGLLKRAWESRKKGGNTSLYIVITASFLAISTIGVSLFPGVEWMFILAVLMIASGALLVLSRGRD